MMEKKLIVKIYLVLKLMLLSACNGSSDIYLKFVYDLPVKIDPLQSVSEVENWTVGLLYRKLVFLDINGVIRNDLAENIKADGKNIIVDIKPNQYDAENTLLNADVVKDSFDRALRVSKSRYIKNIDNIKVVDNYKVLIVLKKKNIHFLRHLSSHLFSIHRLNKKKPIESGIYRVNKMKRKKLYLENYRSIKGYPHSVILLKKGDKDFKKINNYRFDTFLDYTRDYDLSSKLKYRIHENWGLVLNLKSKFKKLKNRICLSQKIDREAIVKNVLFDHKVAYSLDNSFVESGRCKSKLSFKLLVPFEIGRVGEKICNELKKSIEIKCIVKPFVTILDLIKTDKHEAALISLTTDSPFLESNLDLLNHKSSFSIVNKAIEIPSELESKTGKYFFREFEKYVFDKRLFISITSPIRVVFASEIKKYKPSLINPSCDSVENLKR